MIIKYEKREEIETAFGKLYKWVECPQGEAERIHYCDNELPCRIEMLK